MPNMFGGDQLGEDYDPCGYEKNPGTVQVIVTHVPSGRVTASKPEEFDEEQLKQLSTLLKRAASGDLGCLKIDDKDGNNVIFGKNLLPDCEFLIKS